MREINLLIKNCLILTSNQSYEHLLLCIDNMFSLKHIVWKIYFDFDLVIGKKSLSVINCSVGFCVFLLMTHVGETIFCQSTLHGQNGGDAQIMLFTMKWWDLKSHLIYW